MKKIISLCLIVTSLTACSTGFSAPEPISWRTIDGQLEPINPTMMTYEQIHSIRLANHPLHVKTMPSIANP